MKLRIIGYRSRHPVLHWHNAPANPGPDIDEGRLWPNRRTQYVAMFNLNPRLPLSAVTAIQNTELVARRAAVNLLRAQVIGLEGDLDSVSLS